MSYPGDRYGYVPPAQYPVGNNQVHPPPSAESVTRPSWNHEDGIAFFDDRITPGSPSPSPSFPASSGRPEAELFMTTGPAEQRQNPAMDGYRHQYTAPQSPSTPTPTHTSYNPQSFAPSPSTNLPYHVALPSQVQRYTSPTSSTYPVGPATNFAQQVYNPAAYANTNVAPALPQRQPSAAGYHNYNYGPSAAYAEPTSPVYGAPPYAPQYGAAYPGQNMPSYGTNGAGAVTFQSQTPYPTHSQIPVGPQSADPNSFISRTSRSNSQTSQVSSLGGSPGLQRHPTNAPLPSRPMDEVPEEARWSPMWEDAQNSLMQDIVSDLGSPDNSRRHQPVNGNISDDDLDLLRRSSEAAAATANTRPAYVGSNLGQIYETSTHGWDEAGEEEADADEDSDESDPEGAAGLLAMQEDMEDRRFGDLTMAAYMERPSSAAAPAPSPLPPPPEAQASSDSALDGVDLSLYGGGHAGTLGYGPDVTFASGESATYDAISRPMAPPRPSRGGDYPPYDVSVDYGGTGGLQAPQRHRLSFDEGDEAVSVPTRRSGGEFPYTVPPYTVPPYTEDYPDMFYHPGLSSRPLPALPPGSDSSSMPSAQSPHPGGYHHGYSLSADSRPPLDSQARALAQQQVERSISLSNHSTTPPVVAPARSRTDAAEERRRLMRQTMQQHGSVGTQYAVNLEDSEVDTPASLAAYDTITLPTGRKRKFSPSKLTSQDVQRCAEPWALGRIEAWVREMTEEEQYLTRTMVEEAILNLFCAKVPTMKVAEAEALSASVVLTMQKAQVLVKDEDEWIKFGPGQLSGVLWQLTGSGCYAPRLHEDEREVPRLDDNGLPLRCYSLHCGRTLKKVNLDQMTAEEEHTEQDWARFWNLGKEELDKRAKKEIERQNVQHELITGEEDYMAQLDVLRLLYRDQLRTVQPPVIALNRVERFIGDVFGKVDAVQQINKENLLSQLKYRQQEQGPFISGFSDIFREWIRKARPIYIDFCAKYPYAAYLIRKEAERNMLFRQYLDTVRDHPKCRRLEWTTFVRAPIARLQRYGLLLGTIHKNMVQDSEEKANLVLAIEEVKRATHDCDAKVAETTKKVELLELQSQLVLRPGFQSVLHLDHLGRQLLKQGDLQRQGSKGVRWVDTHALLFDHYFILAKEVNKSGRDKKYDVSKEPIPMPLLLLESMSDDPVSRQNRIAAPLTRAAASSGSGTTLNKVMSSNDRPGLEQTATSSSLSSLNPVTRLGPGTANNDNIIYPFRVKHLGHDVYTLYTSTQMERESWCKAIMQTKELHARALHAQNAEPFRLRVLADTAFGYDSATAANRPAGVTIQETPLHRAVQEMDARYGKAARPPPVCRAAVHCAAAFGAYGKDLMVIGTDFGVYVTEAANPRGWTRSVQAARVTQMAVLEDFFVCLLIADRSLMAYPLDQVVAPKAAAGGADGPRRAPQRLAKDVAFFATARMKERTLVFYKRKEGMHNTFKVLEPVLQKASEKRGLGRHMFRKPGVGGGGTTESWRDFDDFYLPTECYGLNLFHTYIAVASARGFELLTLDKKITQSIPRDLAAPATANMAARIRDQRPLGMFRLNEQEFLLAYEDCAVYVDKHGEVSRTLIMEYSGKQKRGGGAARGATMFGQYLVLFNEDYVEVRNAENGRLRQIIAGRDVRCLDYGYRGPTGAGQQQQQQKGGLADWKGTVKICMSHPEVAGGQIVLEMVLNDGHAEKAT